MSDLAIYTTLLRSMRTSKYYMPAHKLKKKQVETLFLATV